MEYTPRNPMDPIVGAYQTLVGVYAYAATHDALTGLPNRPAWELDIQERMQQRQPFGILYIDLDRFKAVNDTLDHSRGNVLLHDFGAFVPSRFRRKGDTVAFQHAESQGSDILDSMARWAGDEFAITVDLSPGTEARRGVDEATGNRKTLEERMSDEVDFLQGVFAEFIATQPEEIRKLGFGISCGYVLYDPEQPVSFEDLFERVDALMQANKAARKEATLNALPRRKRAALRLASLLVKYAGAKTGR